MKRHLTLSILLPLQILVYALLSAESIELYYIPYLFKPLSTLLRLFSSIFPFSIGLVIAYIAPFVLFYALFKIFRKNSFKNALIQSVSLGSLLYFFYMMSWGLLYHRQNISERMGFSEEPIKIEELKDFATELVQNTNQSRRLVNKHQLDTLSFETQKKWCIQAYSNTPLAYTHSQKNTIKKATLSPLLAYFGTGGIYTFWTGEANVNAIHPNHELPNVTLHEMAHQIGIASEDEANFMAWHAAQHSQEPIVLYSANYAIIWRTLNRVWYADSTYAKHLYSQLDSLVMQDLEKERQAWKPYRNYMQEWLISPIYSWFLKANGEVYGILSYDRVIDLIIQEKRRKLSHFSVNS